MAKVGSVVGYNLLMLGYYFVSVFRRGSKNKIDIEDSIEEANSIINKVRQKPKMECVANPKEIKNTIDLSIIMPAYNVEKYIGECIESIINQKTRYSFELIIVNDIQ